jgi:hypothetical protein
MMMMQRNDDDAAATGHVQLSIRNHPGTWTFTAITGACPANDDDDNKKNDTWRYVGTSYSSCVAGADRGRIGFAAGVLAAPKDPSDAVDAAPKDPSGKADRRCRLGAASMGSLRPQTAPIGTALTAAAKSITPEDDDSILVRKRFSATRCDDEEVRQALWWSILWRKRDDADDTALQAAVAAAINARDANAPTTDARASDECFYRVVAGDRTYITTPIRATALAIGAASTASLGSLRP